MVASGLFCVCGERYVQIPLQHVRVDASIYDLCAEVRVQQTYVVTPADSHHYLLEQLHDDDDDDHLPVAECVYVFPLDEESAVFSFECDLDGVVVKGTIKERGEARTEYVSALHSRRSAMLLEQTADNVFQCRVGGTLRRGSVCKVTLTYLTQLDQEGRNNRFVLPMVVAPKYTPPIGGPTPPYEMASGLSSTATTVNSIHPGFHCEHCLCTPIIGTRHHCPTCHIDLCDTCQAIQPHQTGHALLSFTTPSSESHPTVDRLKPNACDTTPTKLKDLTIHIKIAMPSPILSLKCPSHPQEAHIDQQPGSSHQATVSFHSTSTPSLSSDFILLVQQQLCLEPRVLCELDIPSHTAALSLAFIPPPLDMLSVTQLKCELVFLLDCSGSMHGPSIACVRECMHLLLHSLPVNSRFNIITFGSHWSSLFPNSQTYDDTSLSAAVEYVTNLEASMGGTEIYPPLYHALSSDILNTHPRQVFLLTDGQVTNLRQLVHLTSQHAINVRLFTFGIGKSVDRALCKKLAQAGRGKCEFVAAEEASDMREKVIRQVARAMQPVLTDVKVDWKGLNLACSTSPFIQCPSDPPAIFMNSRYLLYALNATIPERVWLQVQAGEQPDVHFQIDITATSSYSYETDRMCKSVILTGQQFTKASVLHTLAAKARIRELEDKSYGEALADEERKKLKDEILQLALKHTLVSSSTSFVVVCPDTGKGEDLDWQSSEYADQNIDLLSGSFSVPIVAGYQRCSLAMSIAGERCELVMPGAVQSFKHGPQVDCKKSAGLFPRLFSWARQKTTQSQVHQAKLGLVQQSGNIQPTRTSADPFHDLINLQAANGVWHITPELIILVQNLLPSPPCSIGIESLLDISKNQGVNDEVVGVLLALLLLETQFLQRHMEWQMVAVKAQYYLNQQAQISPQKQAQVKQEIQSKLFPQSITK